jgi:hypothetical protein
MADSVSPPEAIELTPPPQFIRPNFENMPADLKQRRNWLLWVPVYTGSKWTKRPIQLSGFGASTTNPGHWSAFDDIRRAYVLAVEQGGIVVREKTGNRRMPIGGVGFVFDNQPDEDGHVLAGADFDRVISGDGKIASFAAERVKSLGSYCECSVSGSGLHVILKARPLSAGIAHAGVELYTGGRYFAMTGGTGKTVRPIIAAPDPFAALAKELLAQKSRSSHTDDGYPTNAVRLPANGEQVAHDDGSSWLHKLPVEKRSEVIKYAALYIAGHSKLFALTEHGGNYQGYFKLTLAIARSGVPDAEDIFVEAASSVKGADSGEELRNFFQNCDRAHPHTNGVTVGTLLHIARQCGADFNQWKQLVHASDPNVAKFVPGNEEQCRKLLDRVVAEDRRTFTLGDHAGPLVILRVPDGETLPAATRWEGDLPATTLATPADIMQRAERLIWKRRGSDGRLVHTYPPRPFIHDYLNQMRGQYGARPLRGIVRVPRIDDTGAVHFIRGYDPQTGLFHDKSASFDVSENPSRRDARRAAIDLLHPFSEYKFENRKAGRALILAAIFTAIERPYLSIAPMFVVRSSMPGTGKGLLVRSLVRLAFDTAPVVVTWGGTSEEFEKRLAALLLRSPAALSIDNANGMLVQGDLLESIITEGCADIRPLGRSEIEKVRCRPFTTLTGNNPTITGDMARRALVLDIVPGSAEPERDRYDFNPVHVIDRERGRFLRDAFLIMRAFRLAGMPSQGLPAIGSFDEWTRKVRDLVYWLTGYDVSEAFRRNKAEDPRRQGDASLLAALYQHFGTTPFKAADPIDVHRRVTGPYGVGTLAERALHEALEDVLGNRKVDAKLFGYWARRVKGAHVGGLMLETRHDPATNANVITIRKT